MMWLMSGRKCCQVLISDQTKRRGAAVPTNITITISDKAASRLDLLAQVSGRSRSKTVERITDALASVPAEDAEALLDAGDRAKSLQVGR